MAVNIVRLPDQILEKTTPKITATVVDEIGAAIPGSSLASLTLSLYSVSDVTFPTINNRADQNVLNTNNVTIDASGLLTWSVQAADTQILDSALSKESHRAVFSWTYNGGVKTGRHVIDMTIVNLEKLI